MSQAALMVVGEQFFAAPHGILQAAPWLNPATICVLCIYSLEGETDAHHFIAADGLESLPPREKCSLAHITVEDEQLGPPGVTISEYGWEIKTIVSAATTVRGGCPVRIRIEAFVT